MVFSARSHRCRWPAALLLAACALGATVSVGACSLGDTSTPRCDPTAAPNANNSCIRTPACDQGNGLVVASDGCCLQVGNYHYGACEGALSSKQGFDFRTLCGDGGTPSGCCKDGESNYKNCMAGKYPIAISAPATSSSSTSSTTGGSGGGDG